MKKITWVFVSIFLLFSGIALAADLTAKDAKILKEAEISLYKGAEFLNGGLGDEVMGYKSLTLASNDVV